MIHLRRLLLGLLTVVGLAAIGLLVLELLTLPSVFPFVGYIFWGALAVGFGYALGAYIDDTSS